MRLILFFALTLTLTLAVARGSWAGEPTPFILGASEQLPREHLELLIDPEHSLTVDEVHQSRGSFEASDQDIPNFGFTDAAIWGRFEVSNPLDRPQLAYLILKHAALDNARLFSVLGPDTFSELRLGDRIPASARPVAYRYPAFPIELGPAETRTFYLRLASEGTVQFDIRLESPGQFVGTAAEDGFNQGLYFGVLVAMLLYNGFLYWATRELSFFYLALYVGSRLLSSANAQGHLALFILPDSPDWVQYSYMSLSFLQLGTCALFIMTFLEMKRFVPIVYLVTKGSVWLCLMLVLLSPIMPYQLLARFEFYIALPLSLLALYAGVACWRGGSSAAMYYLFAFALFNVANFVWVLEMLTIIPIDTISSEFVYFTNALSYVVLSMGVGDRMRQLDRELRHTLLNQKTRLERAVEERTHDLDVARERAEVASRAKSAFLSNISHEIRSPLNSILGFTELLSREADIPARHRSTLSRVLDSGRHLLALINDVLNISKIEAGRMELHPERASLSELIKSAVIVGESMLNDKPVRLHFDASIESAPGIHADVGKIRQVLINLVSNAIKFTDEGSVELRLTHSRSMGEQHRFIIDIVDTGRGIAASEHDQVFATFEQTASGTEMGSGSGLGLSISREYARMLGGDISYTSEEGRGSCFTFSFLASIVELPALLTSDAEITGLDSAFRGLKLLIADDNANNRLLLKQILDPLGFDLREASDGAQLLHIAEEWHPALILTDINMPVMDGRAAIAEIRAKGSNVPIVAVTASAFEEEVAALRECGIDEVLVKPLHRRMLLQVLSQQLGLEWEYRVSPTPMVYAWPALDTIDAGVGLANSDNRLALYRRLLEEFRECYGEPPSHSRDPQVNRQWLHRLKGSAAGLGAKPLAHLAGELESKSLAGELLSNDDIDSLETLLNATRDDVTALCSEPALLPETGQQVSARMEFSIERLRQLLRERDTRAIKMVDVWSRSQGSESERELLLHMASMLKSFDFEGASQLLIDAYGLE